MTQADRIVVLTGAGISKESGLDTFRDVDGIWARAPYLHNGSVPTLYSLLVPSARPKSFWRGTIVYDPVRVGFLSIPGPGAAIYDTTLSGLSNKGHDTKEYLGNVDWARDPAKLADLLEYMKTL